jgi:hypothetical protein
MTSDEAQQAQDVVLGMFLASSHPVTILVDSRALRLTKKDGAIVDFVAMVQLDHGSMLNQTKASV